MRILSIETSCDETSAAITEGTSTSKKVKLISNVTATSLTLHAKTGGIIPEIAAREQVKYIIPTITEAIKDINVNEIDALAVTVGPGLIGSLLVGVETVKSLAYLWKKPIIPVNHLFGHIYANWIETETSIDIEFPAICLVVSGGHTDLVLIKKHGDITWLGGTRDDAAGEAYDKIGRVLELPYPAGPKMEKLAKDVVKDLYKFPRPIINEDNFDFSFSGLKAAAARKIEEIKKNNNKLSETDLKNISFSVQEAIFDVLIKKSLKACNKHGAKTLLLGGGVAANQTLGLRIKKIITENNLDILISIPPARLCTDNAAMIGAAACFNNKTLPWQEVDANPELYFD